MARRGIRTAIVAVAAVIAFGLGTTARADSVTVGVYAPSAPFPSTAARVDFASKLGSQLGSALGGTGTGRVYARAGDFAAAVKRGDVTVALVDATYLARSSGYTVIAGATRGGATTHAWQLVARGSQKLSIGDLRGKRLIVPSVGGRETEFAINVMLGGEVARDHFSRIVAAPDTASALAALGLGKVDAALVPAGVSLPGGTTVVLSSLPAIAGAVLVAYGSAAAQRAKLAAAATSFRGDATIDGFRGIDASAVRAIARRFTVAPKRGVLVVPSVRLVVGDLVEGRTFAIERTPVTTFVVKPR